MGQGRGVFVVFYGQFPGPLCWRCRIDMILVYSRLERFGSDFIRVAFNGVDNGVDSGVVHAF